MSNVQCDQHGGAIRNADGRYTCCVQEEWSIDSWEGKPTTPASHPPAEALRLLELARNGSKEQQE